MKPTGLLQTSINVKLHSDNQVKLIAEKKKKTLISKVVV